MTTAKNDSEFYYADLAHSVSLLGAAMRSLERMGKEGVCEIIAYELCTLSAELGCIREERKRERERS